jgi:hypothetical protein
VPFNSFGNGLDRRVWQEFSHRSWQKSADECLAVPGVNSYRTKEHQRRADVLLNDFAGIACVANFHDLQRAAWEALFVQRAGNVMRVKNAETDFRAFLLNRSNGITKRLCVSTLYSNDLLAGLLPRQFAAS